MFRPSYTRLSARGYALFKDLSKKTINSAPSSVNATNSAIPPVSSSVAGATINQLNGMSNMGNSSATVNGEIEPETSASHFSLHDSPIGSSLPNGQINWSDSFYGLGQAPFSSQINEILLAPLKDEDIEITPDGLIYLPEIKYRRILNRAFGPGGWGLAPRTETYITPKQISREYALVCHGRLVSVARGEQDYFGGEEKITTALEGCKSNALMRCCKDLGIASELWDPSFIKPWKQKFCDEVFAEHVVTKRKKKLWKLKRNKSLDYPYKQT